MSDSYTDILDFGLNWIIFATNYVKKLHNCQILCWSDRISADIWHLCPLQMIKYQTERRKEGGIFRRAIFFQLRFFISKINNTGSRVFNIFLFKRFGDLHCNKSIVKRARRQGNDFADFHIDWCMGSFLATGANSCSFLVLSFHTKNVSFGSQLRQIGTKWDNSGTCYDKFSVCFHLASQNYV